MEMAASLHKRSKSDIDIKFYEEDKSTNFLKKSRHLKLDMGQQLPTVDAQNSLKKEILNLQKQLEEQFVVRCELEKGLNCQPIAHDSTNGDSIIKPAKDLIREISILELEVVYLEKYLLSLYRRTFNKTVSSLPSIHDRLKPNSTTQKQNDLTANKPQDSNIKVQKTVDSGVYRSQSSISQHSDCSFRNYPQTESLVEAVDSYHSLPLSMLERSEVTCSSVSLAEHLGATVLPRIMETPNWLSEEMIKSISSIYFQLSDPPLFNSGFNNFSPVSFSSGASDTWSPQCRENLSSSNSWLSGNYFSFIEVNWISRDSERLKSVDHMLQNFRSLVSRLEEVDPRNMKHEEKLAFWINVHNALVMHAFLVYGIPKSNLRRISLILKAAYNVGGQSVSVEMIQSSILGCQLPRPGQWFHSWLFPKSKFKTGDSKKPFSINQTEPRLQFALSSGSHSDPPVRIYTAKRVFQELEMAKEEYIQTGVKLIKEQKLGIPKMVDSFAKEMGLSQSGLMEMIELSMADCLRQRFLQSDKQRKWWKKIEWVPHNFDFRFLFSNELGKAMMMMIT